MSVGILVFVSALSCQQATPLDTQALAKINQVRKSVGLNLVVFDPALSRGCRDHALYLARNIETLSARKAPVNVEDSALPGFTEDGNQAARFAFTYVGGGPPQAVDWLTSTLFARMALLHPDLKRIGLGAANDKMGRSFTVIDINRGRGLGQPLLVPADQQKDVPLAYAHPDLPDPIPEDKDRKAGFPITVTFWSDVSVKRVTATLKDSASQEVEVWLSTPEKPAGPAPLQRNTICLIGKEPLQAMTGYTVTAAAELNGKPWTKTWSFTTGDRLSPRREEEVQPLARLNAYRQLAGLGLVTLDPFLSRACEAHVQYLVKNAEYLRAKNLPGTNEDPKLPGFSEDGQRAARRSVTDTKEAVAAIDTAMATFYRRTTLLDPELHRVGIATAKGPPSGPITVIDLSSGRSSEQKLVFPHDQQKDVPLVFGGEAPNPIPMSKDKKAGFPITVHFSEGLPVSGVTAKLVDGAGKEVAVWLSTPEKPAVATELQRSIVGLIPKEPLHPATQYKVTVAARVGEDNFARTWTFTTAKK
jgi:uncharacterized protein YkwD